MKTDEESLSETQALAIYPVNDQLPRWGQWVVVVTPEFHCPGFLGPDGQWRSTRDLSPIEKVQSWYLVDADEAKVKGQPSTCIFGE